MSSNGFGKLVEDVKFEQVMESRQITAAETKYNGATSASASGVDTLDADEAVFMLNAGVFNGDGTVDAKVLGASTDAAGSASAISDATFTQITSSNDEARHVASVKCQGTARYLFLRTVKGGTGSVHLGASVALKSREHPVSNSAVFDV